MSEVVLTSGSATGNQVPACLSNLSLVFWFRSAWVSISSRIVFATSSRASRFSFFLFIPARVMSVRSLITSSACFLRRAGAAGGRGGGAAGAPGGGGRGGAGDGGL